MIIGDNSRPGTGEYINRELRTETKEQNFYAFLRVNTSNNVSRSSHCINNRKIFETETEIYLFNNSIQDQKEKRTIFKISHCIAIGDIFPRLKSKIIGFVHRNGSKS